MSLGAAAQKAQQAASSNRRTVAEVEGLLEDEEEGGDANKRTLIPIKFDTAADTVGLNQQCQFMAKPAVFSQTSVSVLTPNWQRLALRSSAGWSLEPAMIFYINAGL